MAITANTHALEVFGSLPKSALTDDWWSQHPGALVFPTDENKIYFDKKAYDGLNSTDLEEALSQYYTKEEIDNTLKDYFKTEDFADEWQTQWGNNTDVQLYKQTVSKAIGVAMNITGDDNVSVTPTTNNNGERNGSKIALTEAFIQKVEGKQEKLTQGNGIDLSGDLISVKPKSNGGIAVDSNGVSVKVDGSTIKLNSSGQLTSGLDLTLYKIVTTLPTSSPDPSKIYLVRNSETTTQNLYEEYIWTDSAWEKLGEYKSDIDLTPYITKTEAAATYLSKEDAEDTYLKSSNISGVSAANNKGTKVDVICTPDGKAEKIQIKAAIIIQ